MHTFLPLSPVSVILQIFGVVLFSVFSVVDGFTEIKVARDSFGSNKMCQFFVKTYCLWHKQLENEIILEGHRAPFFRKWVQTLLFSTFLSME